MHNNITQVWLCLSAAVHSNRCFDCIKAFIAISASIAGLEHKVIVLEKVGQGSGVVQKHWQGHWDKAGPHTGWAWVKVGSRAGLSGDELELWVDGSWLICQTSNAHPTPLPVLHALIHPLATGSACATLIHPGPCSRRAGTHDSAVLRRYLVLFWKHHTLVSSCKMMTHVILISVKVRWRLHSFQCQDTIVSFCLLFNAKYSLGITKINGCLECKGNFNLLSWCSSWDLYHVFKKQQKLVEMN